MLIRLCSTIVQPRHVAVGSKTDDSLTHFILASTVWNDAVCDCKGYHYRGSCSHIDQVEEAKCLFWTNEDWHGPCPACGAPVIDFEMDAEWE